MLAGVLGLVTASAFETTAVVSVMPVVAVELDAVRHYGLIFSFFLTAGLLGSVLGGPWCDAKGPRWPTIVGFTLFAAGLLLCGVTGAFWMMLLGRLVSGVGSGLLAVAQYVVLARQYDEADRPRVFGYLSAAWVVPALVGPAVAGWVAENLTWRLVFLGVPPLALVALGLMLPSLAPVAAPDATDPPTGRSRRMALGVGLGLGAGLVQWFSQAVADGPAAWLGVAVGVGLLVPCALALLPAGVLRCAPGLPAVVALRALYTACFMAAEAFVPLALVSQRGFSTFHAGLALSLASIAWAVASWIQGRLRPAPRVAVTWGAVAIAVALAGSALVLETGASGWWVLPAWSFMGLGMGLGTPAQAAAALALAGAGREGEASGALQTCDVLGGVVGAAVTGAVFAAWHQPGQDAGLFSGMWAQAAGVAVLTAVLGWSRLPAQDG